MVANLIPRRVTFEDNNMLVKLPLFEEIKVAIFDLNGDGAPGLDGFDGYFFQTFLDIVAKDAILLVQEFFTTGELLPNLIGVEWLYSGSIHFRMYYYSF